MLIFFFRFCPFLIVFLKGHATFDIRLSPCVGMSQKKAKLDLVFVLFYKLLSYYEIFATYQGSEKYLYDVYLYVIYTNLTL